MQLVFKNDGIDRPKLSIILLDWSCRESAHILDYLAKQTIPRDAYEIIWLEYYSRRWPAIDERLQRNAARREPPPVDQWLIAGIGNGTYYHKHLLYNVGILLSRGSIVVFCDSDALVRESFVEAIVRRFDADGRIVLHLDEVRNNDPRFHPFSYPSIEEIIGEGCINWRSGKTAGLWDTEDILHTRNYGACMAARREDLIEIGGADEHIDYLGHVCGPYEMTFRLSNLGRKEIWDDDEFLYHVWHPGQSGEKNYIGPHDGRHVSTRALQAKYTGRILPWLENLGIRKLRLGKEAANQSLSLAIAEDRVRSWSVDNLPTLKARLWRVLRPKENPAVAFRLIATFLKLAVSRAKSKVAQLSATNEVPRTSAPAASPSRFNMAQMIRRGIVKVCGFVRRAIEFCVYAAESARECLKGLTDAGVNEISLYGTGDMAEIIYVLSSDAHIRLKRIYGDTNGKFHSFTVLPIEASAHTNEKMVVTADRLEEKTNRLERYGVARDRIVIL